MIKQGELTTPEKPTWCPGCGNFSIWASVKQALTRIKINLKDVVITYGIGCSGHACNVIRSYGFEGLHGRPIPVAEGVKLTNKDLKVLVMAGDGDTLGEGLNHFITGIRGNHDVTLIIHDNRVYGLTTGQASPTADKGYKSKSTPDGVIEVPVNPIALAIAQGGSFVARGSTSDPKQLADLIVKGVNHRGFSVIDVLQNCATFNKVNTIQWFREHIYKLEDVKGYKPNDRIEAMKHALRTDKIATGIFYQDKRESYDEDLPVESEKALVYQPIKPDITRLMESFY